MCFSSRTGFHYISIMYFLDSIWAYLSRDHALFSSLTIIKITEQVHLFIRISYRRGVYIFYRIPLSFRECALSHVNHKAFLLLLRVLRNIFPSLLSRWAYLHIPFFIWKELLVSVRLSAQDRLTRVHPSKPTSLNGFVFFLDKVGIEHQFCTQCNVFVKIYPVNIYIRKTGSTWGWAQLLSPTFFLSPN